MENVLAFRSFLGVAIPYSNSNSIPFSRSYFIGGPNDLRAWKIYDLGPGSTKSGLEYNVGNLKFISSLEYSFDISPEFKSYYNQGEYLYNTYVTQIEFGTDANGYPEFTNKNTGERIGGRDLLYKKLHEWSVFPQLGCFRESSH